MLVLGKLSKNRIEVRDFSPSVSGRGSAQAEETRRRSFLRRCEKHCTCATSLCERMSHIEEGFAGTVMIGGQ